jgi:TonB-linked SusC/RagA family outer membrane protein
MKRKLLIALCMLLVAVAAEAQKRTITGNITSGDDGGALPGVNVVEKGTQNGTISDANGNYNIVVNDNAIMIFSFVGFSSQEIPVTATSVVNVKLIPDVSTLSEIVVIGYGQQEKKDVTGSVAAVGTRDFNKGVISSPQDMLIGKVAGVQVTTNSGAPGSGSTIRIRGNGSVNGNQDPLIVIDGFPVDNSSVSGIANPLAALNPNDIETFTVLKDASATAIYGLRAANGVIIITTKKGKEGKPQISYNGNFTASSPMKYVDVLSGDEVRSLANDLATQSYPGINAAAISKLGTANTDWQKQIFRTAVSHDHNLGVSGTYKNFPYRVSYGYTDQEGILKNTAFVRNSLNVNLTPTFLDGDLKVTLTAKGMNTHQNFGEPGAVGSAVYFDPTQPVYDGNTRWGGYYTWISPASTLPDGSRDPNGIPITLATANPLSRVQQTDNRSVVNRLLTNVQVDYRLKFLPALKLTLNAGFDHQKSVGHNNAPNDAAWTYANGGGRRNDYTGNNVSKLLDLYANYSKGFGRHNIDATVGHSYQSFQRDGTNFERNGDETTFTDSQLGSDGVTREPRKFVSNPNYLLSFFGRVNYSFGDRYLLTVSARDDASSRFSKENRWVIFPAAAVAWNINKEGFLSGSKAVSNLKLRASIGRTGQQEVANNPYPYLSTYQVSNATAQYQFGNSFYNTYRPQAYSANLKWETTVQTDVGLDFGLFGDRLTGTIDVYQRKTNNLINNVPLVAGTNFSNFVVTNVGTLQNKGVEVTIRGDIVRTSNFTWNLGFNFTHNENRVNKLLLTDDPNYVLSLGNIGLQRYIQGAQAGQPIYFYNVFQQVYNQTGAPIQGLYVDRTGSGGAVADNPLNRYALHKPQPDYLVGINTRLTYKKFDFYAQGRLSVGNYVYNGVAAGAYYDNFYYPVGYFNNLPRYVNDTKFGSWQGFSDYYVQNASFFKMDNMSLGYNADKLFTEKLKARFSFTVQNAFFVTKYKGIDPEVDGGIDNNIYPRPRVFVLGINLTY